MQPYFFPYIGYFSLIESTNKWVVFDEVQYIRHGWINRNRIMKPNAKDWQYITVPLQKHNRNTLIKDITISDKSNWKEKIYRQLIHYKKKAPFYHETLSLVQDCIEINTNSIVHLNVHILKTVCEALEIDFDYSIQSEMNIKLPSINHSYEWALNISKNLNAQTYINPSGGKEIFDVTQFQKSKINIKFLETYLTNYHSSNTHYFISGLSIIDVMMFCHPQEIKVMLKNVKLS